MPRVNPYRAAFNSGELSPRMAARVDFGKYSNAADLMENFLPLAEGGAMRRPGTKYVAEVKDSSKSTRLRQFEFSNTQAYIVEMGDLYMRFYRDQGQLFALTTDASITNGDFASDLTGWTDQDTGTGVSAWNALGMGLDAGGATSGTDVAWREQSVTISAAYDEQVHVLKFDVIGDPGDVVELRIGTSSTGEEILTDQEFGVGYHTYEFTPGDTNTTFYIGFRNNAQNKEIYVDNISFLSNAAIEITTPYVEADLFGIEGPQNSDTLYLFHEEGNYPVYTLTRSGHHSWSLERVLFIDGPYLDVNITGVTMTPSASTGNDITITASGAAFVSTDVGRLIRIDNPSSGVDWGYAQIVGFTSSTVVTADVKRDFGTTNADANWALGAWSDTTSHPHYGTFFEQRLWACSTTDQPQHIWASQRTLFNDMTPDSDPTTDGVFDGTIEADDAFAYEIAADEVNHPVWLSPGRDLVIGTTGGEWVVGHSNSNAQVTALDVQITRHTRHGSAHIAPVRVGDAVLFVHRGRRKIREFAFRFQSDSNRAVDLTQIAHHITRPSLIEMAFQHEPNNILWTVRSDGQLPTMTYLRDEEVVGWGRQIIGGSFSSGDAVAESVASIPGNSTTSSEDREEVWMIVKRTIDGATKRYIEFLEGDFETGDTQEDAHYVDSGLVYDGAATTTITGLDHLEGETVSVWGDGSVLPDETVSSGQITVDQSVSKAIVGLKYTSKLRSLKWFDGAAAGTGVGKTKRIYNVVLVILNGHVFKIGKNATNLVEYDFREVSDEMDTAVPLFTGEREINIEGDTTSDPRLEIHIDVPAPFTLLGWGPRIDMKENV